MALISCPECGREISDTCKKCVHCGFNIKPSNNKKLKAIVAATVIIAVISVVIGISIVLSNSSPKNSTNDTNTSLQIPEVKNQVDSVNIGGSIKENGFCEIKLIGYDIDKVIMPPSPADYYHYFEADSGNVYVDIIADVKNLKTSAVLQNEAIGYVKIIYDGNYEYVCGCAVEEKNGSDLNSFTNLYTINPLASMRYHILAQLPTEAQANAKSLIVVFNINGTEYTCTLR